MTDLDRKDASRPREPTFPLRLPTSLRIAVDRLAQTENTSVNQFIAMAVVEKISALVTTDEFERRAANTDLEAFDRIMNRDMPEPDLEADWLDRDRL